MRIAKVLVCFVLSIALPLSAAAPAAALSSAPDPGTPSFDGRVNAIIRVGDVVYVGGGFTSMTSGATTVEADHLAAYNALTLQPTSWRPPVDGTVYSLAASDDGSTIYVGGLFTTVAGQPQTNIAAISAADGQTLSPMPNTNASVRAILVRGTRLYIGGAFRKVQGGTPRLGLAEVNATTGNLVAKWAPGVTNDTTAIPIVEGLATSAKGDILAVGKFTNAFGTGESPQPEPNQARFSATTGVRRTWVSNFESSTYDVVGDGTSFYIAGGGSGGSIIHFTRSGKQLWTTHTDGDVQAVGLFGNQVVAGGHFLLADGEDLPRLVALSAADGAPDLSWRPQPNSTDSSVWVVTGTTLGTLYVGGGFTAVGGQTAFSKLAQFSDAGAPASPAPSA